MKTKGLLFTLLLFLPISILAQEEQMSRKERKEAEKKKNYEILQEYHKLVESKEFIIEATQVFGRTSDTYQMDPYTNFFAINQERGTVQLSFTGLIGWNGIGGVTSDGTIDRYELSELREGKPVKLNGSLIARSGGNLQFNMNVFASGQADVTVTLTRGETITFQGRILKLADSKAFKGIPLN